MPVHESGDAEARRDRPSLTDVEVHTDRELRNLPAGSDGLVKRRTIRQE